LNLREIWHPNIHKIVFVNRHLNGGDGISAVARLIAKVLNERTNNNFHVTCLSLNKIDCAEEYSNLLIIQCNGAKLKMLIELFNSQFRNNYIIFDELSYARLLPALPLFNKSISYTHGTEIWSKKLNSRLKAARFVDVLISNSKYTINRAYKENEFARETEVCWLSTEDDQGPEWLPIFESPPTVICIGRMHKGKDKGQRCLIDAWRSVENKIENSELIFIGTGNDEEEIIRYAKEVGLKKVKFEGFINSKDKKMEEYWKKAWVFCMPAKMESFGLVYVEAMRNRIPVVASKHDSANEINLNGYSGFNVNVYSNSDELSSVLTALLKDKNRCKQIGLNGHNRWNEFYRFSKFATRFNRILDTHLKRKRD